MIFKYMRTNKQWIEKNIIRRNENLNKIIWQPSQKAYIGFKSRSSTNNKENEKMLKKEYNNNNNIVNSERLNSHRLMPEFSSYYTDNPPHYDTMLKLEKLLYKYKSLPREQHAKTRQWISKEQYSIEHGSTRLKPMQYSSLINILNKLNSIHPLLLPNEVEVELNKFEQEVSTESTIRKPKILDEQGRAIGIAKRKSARATCYLVRGNGELYINGKPINEVFTNQNEANLVVYPLNVVNNSQNFNAWIIVNGGGYSSQAQAASLALAKSLVIQNPLFKGRLRNAKCLKFDSRTKERKKPGKLGARAMPRWVKR